jgi:hypothetical protein
VDVGGNRTDVWELERVATLRSVMLGWPPYILRERGGEKGMKERGWNEKEGGNWEWELDGGRGVGRNERKRKINVVQRGGEIQRGGWKERRKGRKSRNIGG